MAKIDADVRTERGSVTRSNVTTKRAAELPGARNVQGLFLRLA